MSTYKRIMEQYLCESPDLRSRKVLDIGYTLNQFGGTGHAHTIKIHWNGHPSQQIAITTPAVVDRFMDVAIRNGYTAIRIKTNPWKMPDVVVRKISAAIRRSTKAGNDIILVIKP